MDEPPRGVTGVGELCTGSCDAYVTCGGAETAYLIVVVQPEDASLLASVQVQVVSGADLEAVDKVLAPFIITGAV